jgi:hypothetical protein
VTTYYDTLLAVTDEARRFRGWLRWQRLRQGSE